MKKNIKMILIIIMFPILLIFSMTSVHADAGWDGDYGGGSNHTGGGNTNGRYHNRDNNNNRSNNRTNTSYGSSSSSLEDIIFAILLVTVSVGLLIYKLNKKSSTNPMTNSVNILKGVDEDEIKVILPNFNITDFENKAYDIYKNIQIAWMDFDYDTMRKYTTDELYNTYQTELKILQFKKQKNIMKDFTKDAFKITKCVHNEREVYLTVRMVITCFDYVVDEAGKLLRGNNLSKVIYDYEMTFVKGLSNKDNKCPNCNAPLENNNSSVCPYCNSTIISDNHDWILSKKQVISQTINKKL